MNEKNCGNCRFGANFDAAGVGNCRFNPPTLMYQPVPVMKVVGSAPEWNWGQQASSYPMISNGGWCGQHQDVPLNIMNS